MRLDELGLDVAARHTVADAGDIVGAAPAPRGALLLSDSVAVALPLPTELSTLASAVRHAREGHLPVEVRIGVGPLSQGLPLRVLGHAGIVARTLREDAAKIFSTITRVHIFSSAPKAAEFSRTDAYRSIAALGYALRLAGVTIPITLETARPRAEVPDLEIEVPAELMTWLERAAARSKNGVDARRYALEHAAPSMFGDLHETSQPAVLRLSLGCAPEARFWAVRRLVCASAASHGIALVPSMGLVVKSARIPWYYRTAHEPIFDDLTAGEVTPALRVLDESANPQVGGNGGLRGEVLMALRVAKDLIGTTTAIPMRGMTGLPAVEILTWIAHDPGAIAELANLGLFQLGPRLKAMVDSCDTELSSL